MAAKTTSIALAILLASAGSALSEEVPIPSLDELRTQADDVLKLPNVSARKEIDLVFELAGRLLQENQSDDALKYIGRGLQHYPWNLKYQMIYAELLAKKGELTKAHTKADLVLNHAETEELIEQARQLLSKDPLPRIPRISTLPGTNHCVVLIPFQECEKWLILRIREELSSALDIPVHVQSIETRYPPFSRDQRGHTLNRMRKRFLKGLDNPELGTAMSELGMSKSDLDTDNNVIKLTKHLLSNSGVEAIQQFDTFLADAVGKDPQWNTDHLKATLVHAVKPCRREHVAYLGITSVDIYSDDYNFLFGSANRTGGVMSYHRFKADFNGEIPNQGRLAKRTTMQCLSSIGHIYGVARCTDPTCARAYPNSLAEHDAKTGNLCSECSSAFKRRFEQ